MKHSSMFLTISIFCTLAMFAEQAKAQSDTTTFTYQGELNQNGQPVNSPVDLDFALFDAAVGGNQLGAEIMFSSFPLVDGRFAVDLDFGSGIFDGAPRFLEVTINGNELVPRQRINSSPYAIQSDNTRGLFVDDINNVGIGTTFPLTPLNVIGEARSTRLGDPLQWVSIQSNSAAGAILQGNSKINNKKLLTVASLFEDNGTTPAGESGIRFWVGNQAAPKEAMRITEFGIVEIGTDPTATFATLQVHGDITLGANSQFSAVKSIPDIRIVCGRVSGSGGISGGFGFIVNHTAGTGVYSISFNPDFGVTPFAVVATPESSSRVVRVSGQTAGSATFIVSNLSGTQMEGSFEFIAIGSPGNP